GGPEALQALQVQPQHHGLRPLLAFPFDDGLTDAERTLDDEQRLFLVRLDLHGVVRALGRDLELGGPVLGCISVVGPGDAAEDEENGEGNAAGFHATPRRRAFVVARPTPGEPVGNTASAIVFGTPAGQRSPFVWLPPDLAGGVVRARPTPTRRH